MNKYKQYADLKAKIKALTSAAKELEGEIFTEIAAMDGEKLETKYATFSVMYRKKWKYTPELTDKEHLLKEKIKLMKKREEIEGKAEQLSDGGFLRCQAVK